MPAERGNDTPQSSSAFHEASSQAASIPLVLLSLGVTYLAYRFAERWWSETGDAFRIVPIFYALAVIGAAVAVALLSARVRLLADGRMAWMASGIGLAGLAAFGQAIAVMRFGNAPLEAAPDGMAALYLLWHAALVVCTAGAVLAPTAGRLRWALVGVFSVLIVAVFLTPSWPLGPDLVDARDVFTPLYRGVQGTLTVLSVVAAALWLLRCGRRPTRPEIWIGVGLALAALDMVVATGAEQLFQALWWSSAALRAAQFVAPAVGLVLDDRRLLHQLHLHELSLTERLQQEREAALELFAQQPATDADRARIQQVIDQGQFITVFQPIYSLRTGEVAAVEALTRFTAEPQGTPDQWFREAERCGLGVELELATLQGAIDASRSLPEGVALSVNASPAAIIDGRICETIRRSGGKGMIVEITEHAIVQDYGRLVTALSNLRRCGVLVAIDDAGAGFASFQHVVQVSPDILKLDMSLTRDIDIDPVRRALATSLTAFTQEMNIQLIAEGVETTGELSTLQAIGAHAAQGYLLARPAELSANLTAGSPPVLVTAVASNGHR